MAKSSGSDRAKRGKAQQKWVKPDDFDKKIEELKNFPAGYLTPERSAQKLELEIYLLQQKAAEMKLNYNLSSKWEEANIKAKQKILKGIQEHLAKFSADPAKRKIIDDYSYTYQGKKYTHKVEKNKYGVDRVSRYMDGEKQRTTFDIDDFMNNIFNVPYEPKKK